MNFKQTHFYSPRIVAPSKGWWLGFFTPHNILQKRIRTFPFISKLLLGASFSKNSETFS
jgi:hypothetical protein